MSKTSVGDVYAKVINDVCEASRQDFEEGGVELATLELLKSEWQKKLSGLKVAQLPWDPPPAPAIKEQSVVPSSAKPTPQTLPSNGTTVSTPPSQQAAPPAPQIKAENSAPSFPAQQAPPPPQPYQAPSFQQGQPLTARDRAIMNLHQSFGQRAGPQIAQLQSGNPPRAPMQQSTAPSSNYIKQEEANSGFADIQDYTADIKPQPQAAVNASQTDGSCDTRDGWETEYARRKAFAAARGAEGDGLMRAHFQTKQQELEGGGLLMALDERNTPNRAMARNLKTLFASEGSTNNTSIGRAQGDATGDDDGDDDEDAINSDLDDPDDLAANEENGENTDQVMLCTYDKVQRVKNKWKCTLKDGILRVEGNEYVFHKGQGEFEW
ncbi:uncharacterized protein Z519_11380 [Cladophialophora bantiana CBS 173.52]|uniref:Transcription factor IIA, alpha/beta subunit n=1 Tax=Cladophialophora bantiana (strain ATCC 10958 / CBS 173.52 / CDC B-1940 / NIH 8579) TaxID=1442370 RepID=A0A0D2HUQ3_CLAB1|nr:uncharacterized protein Z519_11380 [Cladophialophora bantiana CBS 173.52]KIW88269.1 hypothetical protein Z519_11380 [Cladophialophora bantiana CBS 173.52]